MNFEHASQMWMLNKKKLPSGQIVYICKSDGCTNERMIHSRKHKTKAGMVCDFCKKHQKTKPSS